MKEKRNIDQLFQEQFDGFEATPSPEVWDRIKAKLQEEKEDRKVIPIWWKLGGVAALLALLLTVGGIFYNEEGNNNNKVVVEDNIKPTKEHLQDKDSQKTLTNDALLTEETPSSKNNDSKNIDVSSDEDTFENKLVTNEAIAEESLPKSKKTREAYTSTEKNKEIVEGNNILKNKPYDRSTEVESKSVIGSEKEAIAKMTIPKDQNLNEVGEKVNSKTVGQNDKLPQVIAKGQNIDKNTAISEENKNETEITTTPQNQKKSIFDAIEEEKAVASNEEESKKSSWEVAPNVGPVYYNSISGGSSIDPSFTDNTQEGNVNFSYGVQVAYNINDKLSIRSGLNNVNLGYNTGGVEIVTGPQSYALKSVDYGNPEGRVLTAVDKGTLSGAQSNANPYDELVLKSTSPSAELTQNISYYEIPLELKYTVLNKKFGINMIGGFSTLLLGNNEIVVNDGNYRGVLGEANNLNNVSFSTNIGFGLDYKISKRLKFNIEPMFKYQLNPYSDSSVNFRPYYLGIYSGFSFKF